MTYTIHFTDNTKTPFTIDQYRYDGPGAINGQNTSLTLLGKGYTDYGQELWTNLVHMLENHSNTMAPAVPIEGQLWYDNSSETNLKICKKAPGGGYKWIDIVDTETFQKLLYSSDFFSESILQSNVRVPSGTATIDGNVHIKGKLEVDNGIYSYRAPTTGNEVVTLSYLSGRLTAFDGKFLPLKLKANTTVDGTSGSLTLNGNVTVTKILTLTNDPKQPADAANKRYVDSAILSGGITWPKKLPKTVLASPNGTDVAFIDISPDYICKTDVSIPTGNTGYNVIASDPSADRAYWTNLDASYLAITSTNAQEVLGEKKFNKLILNGQITAKTGASTTGPGTAGQVLTSQGPDLPPMWSGGSNNQPSSPSFTGMFNNDQNETVTIAAGATYQRGYMVLPNNMIAQWIIGYPLQNKLDPVLATHNVITKDTHLFVSNLNTASFLYASAPNDDVLCRYYWKYPFSSINFKTVSTQMVDNIGLLSFHKSNYKWSDYGSNNARACVSFQQDLEYLNRDTEANPSFTKLVPVIFALGSCDITNPPAEEQIKQFVFNSTTIWTVPADATNVSVILIGGGGGGATGTVKDDWETGGSGGGSGGMTSFNLDASLIGQSIKFIIGSGGVPAGAGADTSIKQKPSMTSTSYTKLIGTVAGGGQPGITIRDSGYTKGGPGGLPGGIAGEPGVVDKGSNSTSGVRTGNGGDSPLAPGSGGNKGDTRIVNIVMESSNKHYGESIAGVGGSGKYYGAGGGGGWLGQYGGAGSKGVAIVTVTY